MKKLVFIWTSLFIWAACQQVIDLEIPDSSNLVVVEAFLNNEDTIQSIRITRTVGFEDSNISPPITNAVVSLISEMGSTYTFGYQNNGYYLSSALPFEEGTAYRLQIVLPNQDTSITSNEYLQPSPVIDSIHYVSVMIPDELNPRLDVERFYPTVYGKDEKETEDYYLWRVYRNDTLLSQTEELVLIEDRFFNGNQFRNDFTNFLYREGDKIQLHLEMISLDTYDYLRQLRNQNNQLQAYPSRLIGNIQNQSAPSTPVLGIFSIANSKFFKKNIENP